MFGIKKIAMGAAIALGALSASFAHADDTVRYATDGPQLGSVIILAAEKGYFKEEGIDAILQSFGNGLDSIDAVLAGQADFGVVVDMPLVSRLQTQKLVVPTVLSLLTPGFHQFYVQKDIKAPEGLKGKNLGIVAGTSQEFVTRAYLKKHGIEDDVTLTNFADLFSAVGAAKSGRIDGVWAWLAGAQALKDDSNFSFVVDDAVIENPSSAMLVTSKAFAEKNPELVVKSLKAIAKAAKFIDANLEEAANIVANKAGADIEKTKRVISNMNHQMSLDKAPIRNLEAKYKFLVDAGKVEAFDFIGQFNGAALSKALPNASIDPEIKK